MELDERGRERVYQLMLEGVKGKYTALLQNATFACALLVIGSFNDNLFPLTDLIRVLIIVLLIVVTFCLYIYLAEVTKLSSDASVKLSGKEIGYPAIKMKEALVFLVTGKEKNKSGVKIFSERLSALAPYISFWLLFSIVFVLIVVIILNSNFIKR
jgi:hypothetical protein